VKILIISQRFRPLIGGAETVLGELAAQLVRLGHAVTLLTARWDRAWPAEERVDGVHIVRLPLPRLRMWGTWVYMRALRGWLARQGGAFDVWYVSMLKHSAWIAVGAARDHGVPVVLRTEGGGPTGDAAWQCRALGGKLIRRRCRRALRLVIPSAAMRTELEAAGYAPARVVYIANGVRVPREDEPAERTRWRRRLGLEPDARTAVFVGRISPEKGVADLTAAWPRVAATAADAQLILVGGGPAADELRAATAGDRSILWVGPIQEPQRYLRAADLFVLPSHEEGMSVALLEAMALALPIVASDIPGNRLLVEHGRHGLLVAVGDPERLAGAVLQQWRDPERAAAMAQAARRRVQQEFSIERMAERHLELFESLRGKVPARGEAI
jgi:glycosyltransferase involved in cell wall biosynthesis